MIHHVLRALILSLYEEIKQARVVQLSRSANHDCCCSCRTSVPTSKSPCLALFLTLLYILAISLSSCESVLSLQIRCSTNVDALAQLKLALSAFTGTNMIVAIIIRMFRICISHHVWLRGSILCLYHHQRAEIKHLTTAHMYVYLRTYVRRTTYISAK